ncbi:XRE family transcriptional regulator [Phytohabitans sp. ZYX-F-186]|uniref:XRE family transcriptional regulator n=1 Tax=Phytohabitans maris TaxID=3071409 RepID=A0ABU0ZTK3_9ACTN|nr:XRE family transcriptional regulator [Phytohabitans sp. ZYX-F-186]MDQ7910354.1 XRE family transcriptional regulator [Phytohabitans sp. ZYX-F-186]
MSETTLTGGPATAGSDEGGDSERPAGGGRRRDPGADPTDGIGRRVAAFRTERGIRVSDLARHVGVSPSLVSQIERGLSRPSVSTLFAIAEALEVPVDAFFRETDGSPSPAPDVPETGTAPTSPAEERYVVRRANRPTIDIESGVRWERLTPTALKNVEFLELVYGPGAESNSTLYRHAGEEMILVLSGELDIYLGFEKYHLSAGDSMHFSSMQPHRYVNPTASTTHAVTTILHDGDWYATPGNGH